jgi:hypothetical protein
MYKLVSLDSEVGGIAFITPIILFMMFLHGRRYEKIPCGLTVSIDSRDGDPGFLRHETRDRSILIHSAFAGANLGVLLSYP